MTALQPITFQSPLRLCTLDDVDWMVGIANDHYPGEFDVEQAKVWGPAHFANPDMLFIRGERSFGVAHVVRRFNAPKRLQCYQVLLYAEKDTVGAFEPFLVRKALKEWAAAKGASKFWMSDISGIDLGPFAKRLGGRMAGHTYVVDLDEKGNRYG